MKNVIGRAKNRATSLTNKFILPKMSLSDYGPTAFFSINPVRIRDMVMEYLLNGHHPHKIDVINGVLYIDEDCLGRIAMVPNPNEKSGWSCDNEAMADFYEEKILARQEKFTE